MVVDEPRIARQLSNCVSELVVFLCQPGRNSLGNRLYYREETKETGTPFNLPRSNDPQAAN